MAGEIARIFPDEQSTYSVVFVCHDANSVADPISLVKRFGISHTDRVAGLKPRKYVRCCGRCGALARIGHPCPACGALVVEDETPIVMCGYCGRAKPAEVTCPHCGRTP